MKKLKLFGALLEHIGFYSILIFIILFLVYRQDYLIYLAMISWAFSIAGHIIEHKVDGRPMKKIIFGA
ncbi:MAG: hypothetical protein KJ697_03695 [Nanoarchaeota archaeon]|nr:hypothetical protein [Nanoarchaeota archaeon]MBU4124487.1 hypothetical protein [Nanoarchaeota archaeon]